MLWSVKRLSEENESSAIVEMALLQQFSHHNATTTTFVKHMTKDDNMRMSFYCMSNTTLKGIVGCFTYRCIVYLCEVSDQCKSGDMSLIGWNIVALRVERKYFPLLWRVPTSLIKPRVSLRNSHAASCLTKWLGQNAWRPLVGWMMLQDPKSLLHFPTPVAVDLWWRIVLS